jgi:NADPH:quinone reductase
MLSIPATMIAITTTGKGGPEVMVPASVPTPIPTDSQILIRVHAAGVNRPDVLQRKGLYPAPKGHSELLGLEVAGEVVHVGSATTRYKIADRVMALVNGGGYAEYCVAEEGSCLPVPTRMSMREAASIPETFFTVWHNVFERGNLDAGEWFLVHGGSSGIGVTAIQLAKAAGAKVIATAGSADKCAACQALGADVVIDYTKQDFSDAVKAATQGRGVDVILDMVGGDYIDKNIRALADDGRLVNIGFQSGSVATLDLMRVMLKRLTVTGSTLRVRTQDIKTGIARAVETNVLPLFEDGSVKAVIDSSFTLQDAAEAHARMESSQHIGKIVLLTPAFQ